MVENLLSITRIQNDTSTVICTLEPVEEVVAEAVEVGVPAGGVARAVVALPLVLPLQCHGGITEVVETKLLAARRKRRHHNYGG